MSTGKTVAGFRKSAGLTQEELADRLAVSRSLVARWESGERRPDRRSSEMMGELFGVSPDVICGPDPLAEAELSSCLPEELNPDCAGLVRLTEEFLYSLGEKDRNIFIRRYHFYDRPAEISERYGLSQGSVRISLYRSRKKLKAFMMRKTEEK